MKKLLDSKFLFILALSIIVLIILGIGAFYLFDDSDDVFVKDGYVLNPLSAKSEKYFFDENTTYKENLSSMIVFNDVDQNEVSILKDSFLHYMDGSLSFLKNGAILDLNSINGDDAVKFYNITSKSIISKSGNGYVIETSGEDINLNNFIGRISDNKYIAVGSLQAKIPGNETNISGDYFEIVYTEEGVINIENKDVKYQVAAEGTYIYAGDVVIDLGNKKITKNGEDVMSITAITINGDENIEIIPKAEEKENDGSGNGNNDNTATTDNNPGQDANDNQGGGEGSGTGSEDDGTTVKQDELVVSLKNASIGSTNVDVTFDIDNLREDDSLTLKVTNLDTGRTIDMLTAVTKDEEIRVNLLSPSTKYLFTVINERDNGKYFQKIFETTDFGIKLEKSYATESEIGYKITVGEDTDITDARLTLYKFNEDNNENESIGSYKLSDLFDNVKGEHDGIVFSGLDSDTIYTAVLDEFSLVSTNFKDIYNITLTSMTLKKMPSFSEMVVNKDTNNATFKLSLENISDPDNAIVGYTYLIYENNNRDETAISPISKTNASPVEVRIGSGENELKNDTNYFYKAIIEYFDNEKYIEYITTDSINFVMGSDPFVTVVPNEEEISYNRIGATIYLTDNSCLISMPGREKCDDASSVVIDVRKKNAATGYESSVAGYPKNVEFEVDENIVKYDLVVNDLEPGTTYVIYVSGIRNDMLNEGLQTIMNADDSKPTIATKYLSGFTTVWQDNDSTVNHPINTESQFIGVDSANAISPEDTADIIKKVVVMLYDGSYDGNLQSQRLLTRREFTNNEEFNIKEQFYDNAYQITTDETFGLDIDGLKELTANSDGKLSEFYTIAVYAYYDVNETNAVNMDGNIHSYRIAKELRADNINDPKIELDPIKKTNDDSFDNLSLGTIVGYTVTASFDKHGLDSNEMTPTNINMYVYNDSGSRVQFYTMDNNGSLRLVDNISSPLGENGSYEANIYMGYGTDYSLTDTIMSRGNKYYIGYEIVTSAGLYPSNSNEDVPASYGLYQAAQTQKDNPKINYMYVSKSTIDSITYKYEIIDADNAIYKDSDNYGIYYYVNDGEENKLNLTKIDGDILTFNGEMTVSNLDNSDAYSLYIKKNITKTGVIDDDVKNYFIGDENKYFDGYYDATDGNYNFSYEVINNPLTDNKVTIKVLASDTILDRVLSYKVKFVDSNSRTLEKEFWKLSLCDDDETNRCFSVDYIDLKNAGMKSEGNVENTITVHVSAIYDNGLMGYDYEVGENKDYPYMIMQDNSTTEKYGKYASFSNGGQIVTWSDSLNVSKGYYTYSRMNGAFGYYSELNTANMSTIRVTLGSNGYYSSGLDMVLNPKMVSVDEMSSSHNTFSFSSITPKVSINKTTRLINGAIVELALSGADIEDFCEENNGNSCVNTRNGDKYLYIETWDDINSVGDFSATVRPTLKIKINNEDTSETLTAEIINLLNGRDYYYNVYAYLNKNNSKEYTQLFDSGYTDRYDTKTYTFKSKLLSEIYSNYAVTYRIDTNGEYNDKLMDTKINLISYDNQLPFNFDVAYALCEYEDDTCGISDESSNIFKSSIAVDKVSANITDTVNISEYDLVFNKNYYMYIYVTYDYYDLDLGEVTKKTLPFYINKSIATVNLKKLDSPEFVVSREASYENGEYVIDLKVNVKDTDRVLVDGNYYVKLLDTNGDVVGNLQLLNEENNYVIVADNSTYDSYPFDALVSNKSIRIGGLTENTKYTIVVFGNAYMNNYGEDETTKVISKSHTVYSTNSSGVSFGNDVSFGITENSVVVSFPGGSNFDNVRSVEYTVIHYDGGDQDKVSGSYTIGENDKYFEINTETDEWRFVIDPEGMTNILGHTYVITTAYHVYNPQTGEIEYFDSTINPSFSNRIQYVKNNNNNN